MRQGTRVSWALAALGIVIFSQSCATGGGPRLLDRKPTNTAKFTMTGSSLVYEYERGHVDFETTDLMDIYDNGVIDLLKSPDPQVRKLMDKIPYDGEFYLLVVNGQSSPASLIQINNDYFFAQDYSIRSQKFALGYKIPFQKYTFDDSKKKSKALKSLKLHLLEDAHNSASFVSTNKLCVVKNQPGPRGEYRNGALTLQLIGTDLATFNTITRSAGKKAHLLAEFSVFRENSEQGCR